MSTTCCYRLHVDFTMELLAIGSRIDRKIWISNTRIERFSYRYWPDVEHI